MQDQGKRLLLAVALALGVMLVWNMIFPPAKDPKPAPTQGSGDVTVPPTTKVGITPDTAPAPGVAPTPVVEVPRGPEEKLTLTAPNVEATFSSHGGTLVSWQLADPRFKRDQTGGQFLPAQADTGAFQVNFASSTYVLPLHSEWKGQKISDTEVRYTIATDHLQVEKTYRLEPEAFLIRMTVKAQVLVPAGQVAEQTLAVSSFAYQDPNNIVSSRGQGLPRAWNSSTLRAGEIYHTGVKALIEKPRLETGLTWTGFEHPYLLAAYAPNIQPGQGLVSKFSAAEKTGLMRTDMLFAKAMVKAGDPALTQEIVAYLGPKNYNSLEAADARTEFETHFKKTIDLGWFSFIGKPLLWLLLKFYAFFGNWGVAIILLTFLVKAATLYWTTKSMRSMKAMAALAPQMKALQAKYKDDRQRLQAETMALYKTHSVNPIAGCLPIVLQMPIWLALYRMLSSAGELYQQPFIPGWIDDLTWTDPYHVLPVVLVVTMFAQARLTPATGDSRQQKFLQYGMPLMFGVMSFFFPAGLTLYIFTNTCLSALHSIYMNKYDKKSLALVAKMKAAAEAAATPVTDAKAGAKPAPGKKSTGKNGTTKAKPVIDVASVEADAGGGDAEDQDDSEQDDSSTSTGSTSSAGARPRPKKKKRRR